MRALLTALTALFCSAVLAQSAGTTGNNGPNFTGYVACPNLGYFTTYATLNAKFTAGSVPTCTQAVTGDLGPVWSNGSNWIAFNASSWNPSAVPAPASSAGYTTLTFNTTTIGSTTGTWLPNNYFSSTTPSGAYTQNSDGSITLQGVSGWSGNNNSTLNSTQYSSTATNGWSGIAFGGGAYFEITYAQTGSVSSGDSSAGKWPSLWSLALEHIAGNATGFAGAANYQWSGQASGYVDFSELDFFENGTAGDTSNFGTTIHNWYGTGSCSSGNYCNVQAADYSVPAAGGNLSTKQKVGVLWIPATASTQGYVSVYVNDALVEKIVSWNQWNASTAPPPSSGTTAFGIMDQQHMSLTIGNGSTNSSITVYSVQVWQTSAANNLVQ
jgi:hypothetical protein